MKCMICNRTMKYDECAFRYEDIMVCEDCHKGGQSMPYTKKTMEVYEEEKSRNQEIKQDSGKPRWELVPMKALEGIALVMQDAIEPSEQFPYGRYEIHSWQKVDPRRYMAALIRHVAELQSGQEYTEDTKMRVIDAILTNAMFLSWFLQKGYDIRKLVPEGKWDVPDFMHPDAQFIQVVSKEELRANAKPDYLGLDDVISCDDCIKLELDENCEAQSCPKVEDVIAAERLKGGM